MASQWPWSRLHNQQFYFSRISETKSQGSSRNRMRKEGRHPKGVIPRQSCIQANVKHLKPETKPTNQVPAVWHLRTSTGVLLARASSFWVRYPYYTSLQRLTVVKKAQEGTPSEIPWVSAEIKPLFVLPDCGCHPRSLLPAFHRQ